MRRIVQLSLLLGLGWVGIFMSPSQAAEKAPSVTSLIAELKKGDAEKLRRKPLSAPKTGSRYFRRALAMRVPRPA